MTSKKLSPFTVLVVTATLSVNAHAAIVSADFSENLDLPDISTGGPRILESLATPLAAGFELDESDQTSNPSGWGDSLQVDLTTSTVTLTPTSSNTYQTITIDISNIVFDVLNDV